MTLFISFCKLDKVFVSVLYRVYTAHAGLEVPVDSAVALRTGKTEMLVPNCIGWYGSKAVFWPFLVNGTSQHKIGVMIGINEPKHNFSSLTVYTLDQYLKNERDKLVLLP